MPLALTTSGYLTTRARWVHLRPSLGHTPAQGLSLNFASNANHHGSYRSSLELLLKANPEGPSLIFYAASRHSCRWYEPPFQLSLQHNMVKILIWRSILDRSGT